MSNILKHPIYNGTLEAYLNKENKNSGAVIICPGGAYMRTTEREGKPIARALNKMGLSAFVLHYDVENPPLFTKPLNQLAWAIEHVRDNYIKYNVNPEKIAVMGFSAGGHLAASLGVHWHNPDFFGGKREPEIYKPNALILCYAVLSGGSFRHNRSFYNLVLDSGYDIFHEYSLEDKISDKTPPTFLWHTADDNSVLVENTLLFALNLSKYKIPYEMHIYPHGVHGVSLATKETSVNKEQLNPYVSTWIERLEEWIRNYLFDAVGVAK